MQDDRDVVTTRLGTVSDRRVRFTARSGTSIKTEDIPLRHVTSVSLAKDQRVTAALLVGILALLGIWKGISDGQLGAFIIGILLGGFAYFLFVPRPQISITTAGGQTRVIKGGFREAGEAKRFVAAIERQLFQVNSNRSSEFDSPRWG